MTLLPDWISVNDLIFKCRKCNSSDIEYYCWESNDGAHEDYHYRCKNCKYDWWVEGPDY